MSQLQTTRPVLIKLFNRIGQRVSIDLDVLMKRAIKKEGLSDFGADADFTPLEKLLDATKREAHLHRFGQFIIRERLVGILGNRLRAQYWFEKHPEIEEQQLNPPIIITGLQRTGTTLLQRLLSADPSNRGLLSWEALNPAPFLKNKRGEPDRRIRLAKMSERMLKIMSPQFFAIHPVEHQAPEEDVLLNDHTFISTVPEAMLHVPEYAEWVEEQDHTPAYTYLKKMLKLLQWQRPGKQWVLKSPQHLEFLDTIRQVFPGCTIIQTHRNPERVIPSFCSMVYHSRSIFSDQVSPEEIGRHWLRKDSYAMNKTLEYRAKVKDEGVIDVYYKNLVNDPIACIQEIYQQAGFEYTEAARAAMQAVLDRSPQYKYGVHRYDINDFKLTTAQIDKAFEHYFDRFPKATL